MHFEAGPNTFLQVNRGVCRKLYERVARFGLESGATAAIDAYSGGGILTALLARQIGKAYGIEAVAEASACADALVEPNKLEGRMFNICGRVEDKLPEVLNGLIAKETFLVVDPPRILESGIPRIAMISCNPATMARDVGILTGALIEEGNELKKNPNYTAGGKDGYYSIVSVQPFDMFPQTKWVETLVCLERK